MAPSSANACASGEGVLYAFQDYASLSVRIVAIIIDLVVLWLAWFALLLLTGAADLLTYESTFILWVVVSVLYLTVLKASPVRTAGYALTGVKIINLQGARPSFRQMTFRLLLLYFIPWNLVGDLLWLSGDECRQSLRDKVAGTYVVKRNAKPLGLGPIYVMHLFCFGMNFVCLEVKKARYRRD